MKRFNKNQRTQSDSALNACQKWSKSYDDPIHPYSVVAVQSYKNAYVSTFLNFEVQ